MPSLHPVVDAALPPRCELGGDERDRHQEHDRREHVQEHRREPEHRQRRRRAQIADGADGQHRHREPADVAPSAPRGDATAREARATARDRCAPSASVCPVPGSLTVWSPRPAAGHSLPGRDRGDVLDDVDVLAGERPIEESVDDHVAGRRHARLAPATLGAREPIARGRCRARRRERAGAPGAGHEGHAAGRRERDDETLQRCHLTALKPARQTAIRRTVSRRPPGIAPSSIASSRRSAVRS